MPNGSDLVIFVLSGGKQAEKPKPPPIRTLKELHERYLKAHELGAMEVNSLDTVTMHLRHFAKTLGNAFPVQTLDASHVQLHINRRSRQKGIRKKLLSTTTLKKEVGSMRACWNWGVSAGLLHGAFPVNKSLKYPKSEEKEPFQTWAEIERKISRGGLSDADVRELWDSLFLSLPEIEELLRFVEAHARHDFIYPMFVFAAHTGCRRSEMLRARLDDVDFAGQIRDRIRGVVRSIHTGFHLWGDGGTSKSYTVLDELEKLKADYLIHNTRLTGRGLVDALQQLPSTVHVIEDCESIFDEKRAWGVLRSALGSQSKERPMQREISWTAFRTLIRFIFTGSIILIANKPLEALPELAALATRITVLQLVTTFAEVAALMRSVALHGFTYGQDVVTPNECTEVAESVIDRMHSLARPLDPRVYVNGVKDYLQCKTGHSDTDWKDLIESRLRRTTFLRERRVDVMSREASIAYELSQMHIAPAERVRLWKEKTGKSPRAYWRRLKDLEGGDPV
ncbi:MAG TPA: hypothetical protein VH682_21595 [Gemmataceae bacterium]|jgi:integrase